MLVLYILIVVEFSRFIFRERERRISIRFYRGILIGVEFVRDGIRVLTVSM